ncbi:multidrug resistance-associated ABC transporter [Mycena alexandri]|uniref:Multidrug resistance-associated ABC transporter n=1 Tax=Mycena alexandri TaxID=1745969 RepID=A0AAD6SFZ0_9AGAR|nr:multidrug resistance-associated ABC transporter [Mycena alexandri]
MKFCPTRPEDACARGSWIALAPALVVLVLLAKSLPTPSPPTSHPAHRVLHVLRNSFKTFIPLREAEAFDSPHSENVNSLPSRGRWRSVVFAFLGLLECLFWVADACFFLVLAPSDGWAVLARFMVAFAWMYATVRPIAHPSVTVPYDLVVIYLLYFIAGLLQLAGYLFDNIFSGIPFPPPLILLGSSAHLAVLVTLLYVTMSMPIALPSIHVREEEIGASVSPEDYTSLLGWITFSWVYPLIQLGTNTTLEEKDVWFLSPTNKSKAIFTKFYNLRSATLLRRLWDANSLDLLLDFFGTLGSVAFAYGSVFFLNRLLDSIDHPTGSDKGIAYQNAGLMFIFSILKAQFDAQHLWYGQRAATRIRSELMAAIYHKALLRKDFSGITKAQTPDQKRDAPDDNAARSTSKPSESKADDNKPIAGADIGKIVNLMSGDTERIATIANSMYYVYGAPFEFIIASIFLYQLLGWSAFTGFISILAGVPLNKYLGERMARINKAILTAKDKRMGEVNELLGAIKFVKFFSWEEFWLTRAMVARNEEMSWRLRGRLNNFVWSITPILMSTISFFIYVGLGNKLTVAKAFTALALFAMIRSPLNLAPMYFVEVIQARIAVDRIAVFLAEEEVSDQISSLKQDNSKGVLAGSEDDRLGLHHASFKWNEIEAADDAVSEADDSDATTLSEGSRRSSNDRRFELKDVSVLFPEGVLTVVTGPTASGKTALLMAVLGELTLLPGGRIILSKNTSNIDEYRNMHTISFAAQTPWLRNESIRDNILFGHPWDEERYLQVLDCCALTPDLEVLEDGDATEIGAKGVSLSGGQKARVALARACYARTKWVLLDDPLSAVDSHTARFLCDRLLCGPLLANRTVVLVTHHVELVLPGTRYLVQMKDGRIDNQGTPTELRRQGILEEITEEAATEVKTEDAPAAPEARETSIEADFDEEEVKPVKDAKKPRKLVEDEHRETGSVRWTVYKTYLEAAGYGVWTVFTFLILVQQLKGVGEKLWIKIWGEAYQETVNTSTVYVYSAFGTDNHGYLANTGLIRADAFRDWPSAVERPLYYAGIYAAIGFFGVTIQLLSVGMEHTAALNAAHRLYRRLLQSVVGATFRFHDTTPLGRMLNRFGRDVEIIDNQIVWSVSALTSAIGGLFVSVMTVLVVFPLFVIPASIVGYFYRTLAHGYLHTGRDLRRMESNSRSPIFSDFADVLEGIVTVRAFSVEKRFMKTLHERIDASTQLWYAFWMTNRWLLLNFDFLGSISVFATACFSITFLDDNAGLAGLAITSALTFSNGVFQTLRFWAQLELDLNCVERVAEYIDIPQEPAAIIESYRPPAYWPSSSRNDGLVTLENVVVKYAPELPDVLRGISLSLNAGERVGLVGRTGSGKSTLAMDLSVAEQVDPSSGKIIIDGVDISKIGLYDLRSRITFIPQDASLFSGTLRSNLDPFDEYGDSVCLNVLHRVHLIGQSQNTSQSATPHSTRPPSVDDSVSAADTRVDAKTVISLDTQVSAGGANFSQGQRQLIALARALLRRSAIVILDEATSSVDFETDAKIQTTIREEFTGSLLITVAHRLRTIMDYDRIVVLDQGKVAEVGTPLRLMDKENGIFRTMCLKSHSF